MQQVVNRTAQHHLKERYATLDGARGIAAVLVVLFHLGRPYGMLVPESAYLAVDMFFALSGFVLAKANDSRLAGKLSPYQFMERRAVRLFPLYFIGLVMGLAVLTARWIAGDLATWTLVGSALFGVVLLPAPVPFKPHRLFPANGPSWTLFCEFWVANLAYAIFWRRLHGKALGFVIAVAGLLLVVVALRHHGLDQGSVRSTAIGGIARVMFSFFMGVALWRHHQSHPMRLVIPGWLILLVLTLILCASVPREARAIFDLTAVVLVFPFLILAGATAKERKPEFGYWVGDLSYAVYVTHAPLLDMWMRWWPPSSGQGNIVPIGCFMLLALSAAGLLHKFVDEPARVGLTRLLTRWGAQRPAKHAD